VFVSEGGERSKDPVTTDQLLALIDLNDFMEIFFHPAPVKEG